MQIYKYMSATRATGFLERFQLRFTPPLFLNDPFECRPVILNSKDNRDDTDFWNNSSLGNMVSPSNSLVGRLSDRLGLASFSERYDNPLLWGHYADEYKGICIGFDADHDFFGKNFDPDNRPISYFRKVTYTKERPKISSRNLLASGFQDSGLSWRNWRHFLDNNLDFLITKSLDWKYEKEWRLIRILATEEPPVSSIGEEANTRRRDGSYTDPDFIKSQLIQVPPSAIRSVILGAMSPLAYSKEFESLGIGYDFGLEDEVRARIQLNQALSHVSVLRSCMDNDYYKVRIFDPLDFKKSEKYLAEAEVSAYKGGFSGPLDNRVLQLYSERKLPKS